MYFLCYYRENIAPEDHKNHPIFLFLWMKLSVYPNAGEAVKRHLHILTCKAQYYIILIIFVALVN